MGTETGPVYIFGPFRLDPAMRSLLRDGEPIPLAPKTFALLTVLVGSQGRLVSKEEIIRSLWDEAFVEEGNLTYQVSTLRKALGAEGSRWIETVPKAGYRFLGPVTSTTFTPPQDVQRDPGIHALRDASSRRWLMAGLVVLGLATTLAVVWRQPPSSSAGERALLPTPLTTYQGSEFLPTFSPDGNQVAFQWNGTAGQSDNIYVIAVGAAEPLQLTASPQLDTSPSWSPDGRVIALLRQTSAPDTFDLLLVPPTGGREQKLTDVRSAVRMRRAEATIAWAPDGLSLIVPHRASDETPAHLVSVELHSADRRHLTQPPAGTLGDLHPAYSPDGSAVAFVRRASCCEYQVMLMQAAGGDEREIARRSYIGTTRIGLAWLPDGAAVIWSFGGQLWRVPLDGRPMARIVEAGTSVGDVAVARHGQRLAYAHDMVDKDIWSVDLTLSEPAPRRYISSTKMDGAAQFSADGERIVFASDRSGAIEIWIADANGSNPLRLTGTGASGSPRWSPDGKWIAFDSTASGNAEIYIIDASGGIPRRLTDHPAEDSIPVWSPDGRWIYFTSTRTGHYQIWRIEAASNGEPAEPAAQITRAGGRGANISADGYLYYVRPTGGEHSSLFRTPAMGDGPEETVVPRFEHNWPGYSLSDQHLYYIDAEEGIEAGGTRWKLRCLDPEQGFSVEAEVPLPWRPDSVATSPDGRTVLLTVPEDRGSDLMLLQDFR
jgi:Tol biopolymer transport system component/DNA-binding winged helix-turn-helix (wHTH) protein